MHRRVPCPPLPGPVRGWVCPRSFLSHEQVQEPVAPLTWPAGLASGDTQPELAARTLPPPPTREPLVLSQPRGRPWCGCARAVCAAASARGHRMGTPFPSLPRQMPGPCGLYSTRGVSAAPLPGGSSGVPPCSHRLRSEPRPCAGRTQPAVTSQLSQQLSSAPAPPCTSEPASPPLLLPHLPDPPFTSSF